MALRLLFYQFELKCKPSGGQNHEFRIIELNFPLYGINFVNGWVENFEQGITAEGILSNQDLAAIFVFKCPDATSIIKELLALL